MRIKYIEIKNFRSIKNYIFKFDRNFQVLVGINESGKTNVLKAIALLDPSIKYSKDDIRDPGHDEGEVKSSYVRFVFTVDKATLQNVYEKLTKQILSTDKSLKLLDRGASSLNLKDYCFSKDELLYVVNIIDETRRFNHWAVSGPQFRIAPEWKKVSAAANHPIKVNGQARNLSEFKIVNTKEFDELPQQFLEPLDISFLNTFVGNELVANAQDNVPNSILWSYSEDNILPSRISLSQFISDPNICVPLKNMFSLAQYSDIPSLLQGASSKTNGLRNIFRKVGENTTSHMKKVWPEWKSQKVTLQQNGDFIEAGIEDEYNIYSLSRRSDGFKRFFTFLLMISAQNKTEAIFNNVIVIDEPDIGLHPSGVQYLRDELKKIGQQNLVLVSTHSIFMIDKEIVDRHLIVEKDKEVTTLTRVDSSTINDEEVVYKALGYSLYELLRPKNIIFEGWRDKKIFEAFMRSNRAKELIVKENKNKIGYLHAQGVKDVHRIANICENFNRDYIIITDSDKPAKEKKKQFEGMGEWFLYTDFKDIDSVTTEDFLINPLLNKAVRHSLKINDIDDEVFIADDVYKDKLLLVDQQLSKLGITDDRKKIILNDIKEYSCLNAKASDLVDSYGHVVKAALDHLFK